MPQVLRSPSHRASLCAYALLGLALAFQMFALSTPLSSAELLGAELVVGTEGAEPLYGRAPFQYRWSFRALVEAFAGLLGGSGETFLTGGERFYWSFVTVSALCWVLALAGITRLLRLLDLRGPDVFFGQLAFVTAFGVVRAYGYPCHTREDPLAYALLAFGLCFWIERRYPALLLTCVVAALTREPTLVLPGAFFLLSGSPLSWRVACLAASGGAVVALRLLVGFETHEVVGGFFRLWSTMALETLLCMFLGLGWMWATCVYALVERTRWPEGRAGQVLGRSLRIVLPVMCSVVGLAAIVREFRLVFVFAPWVVPLTAAFVSRWLADAGRRLSWRMLYGVAALYAAVLAAPLLLWAPPDASVEPATSIERYGAYGWVAVFGVQTAAGLMVLVTLARAYRARGAAGG